MQNTKDAKSIKEVEKTFKKNSQKDKNIKIIKTCQNMINLEIIELDIL